MMTTTSEPADEADAWLDSFEQRWLTESDPPDIAEECRRLSQSRAFDVHRVAWELAMADIELRWRHARHGLRRGLAWYSELLAEFGVRADELEELAINELVIRSRWGDQPSIDDLIAEQFPLLSLAEREALTGRWRQQMDLRFPICCHVSAGPRYRFHTNIQTPCSVGRQRSSDAAAEGCYHDPRASRWRLVVAERAANSVSREQLLLIRTAVNRMRVTPLSATVAVFTASGRLEPNVPVTLPLDGLGLDLRFGPLLLQLRRAP